MATTYRIHKEKNLTKVSEDMSYCIFEEPANTWVTSPRITINLTFYIHGVVGVLGTGDQSGNGCFYEQENAVTQFPESRTYLATLRHGDMERLGICIVVLNVVIGLLVCLFFKLF